MLSNKDKIILVTTASVYLIFNLRPSANLLIMLKATLSQILTTALYAAGIALFIVSVVESMADGKKVP